MAKHLCKLSQSVKKNFETIASLVDRPQFVCTDCGRAANEKKRLCEPKRIPGPRRGRSKKDKSKSGPAGEA
jgi:hypothetical protein